MSQFAFVWIVLLLGTAVLPQSSATAEEQVAHLSMFYGPKPGVVGEVEVANAQRWQRTIGLSGALTPKEIDERTFTVYTKAEVDAQDASWAQKAAAANAYLLEMVNALRKDIKTLADLNDALTKRLDDVEKKGGRR